MKERKFLSFKILSFALFQIRMYTESQMGETY